MENATQTLGRLKAIAGVNPNTVYIDLRNANLQGYELKGAKFQNGLFGKANIDGAKFYDANLNGADFTSAHMNATQLNRANLQGADISFTELQSANLKGANLTGADLYWAEMNSSTNVSGTIFRYSALGRVDYTEVKISQHQLDEVFYDGSAKFSKELRLAPDRKNEREYFEFQAAWREWQKSIGFDPDTYKA